MCTNQEQADTSLVLLDTRAMCSIFYSLLSFDLQEMDSHNQLVYMLDKHIHNEAMIIRVHSLWPFR